MKVRVLIFALVSPLVLCVGLAFCRWISLQIRLHQDDGRIKITTKYEITRLHRILRAINQDKNKNLSGVLISKTNDLATVLFGMANQGVTKEEIDAVDRWVEKRAFVDAWDEPYNFLISKGTNYPNEMRLYIDIWSSGPNRINESRKNDDISTYALVLDVD